jgi:2-dehydropantoate 2-reductase
VLVAGLGAIGGITAAFLARAGVDVIAVDPWFEHVLAVRRGGLRLQSPDDEFSLRLPVLFPDELGRSGPFDAALLSVKSYDTEWMARLVLAHLAPAGFIVSLQNGLNEPRLAGIAGAAGVVGCVVHMNGAVFTPGEVTRFSSPRWSTFSLGELDGRPSARLEMVAELFSEVGETEVTAEIYAELWAKLAVNTMTNPLAGATGLTSRQVWSDPELAPLAIRLAAETVSVGTALGHRVPGVKPTGAPEPLTPELLAAALSDPAAMARAVGILRAVADARSGGRENPPSLLQDIRKGRRTEIDYLNGEVISQARSLGISAPANEAIVPVVKAVEAREIAPSRENVLRVLSRLG